MFDVFDVAQHGSSPRCDGAMLASGQPRVTLACSQRQSDPDAVSWPSYMNYLPGIITVPRRVVSHCITPRPRLSSPTGSCQLHTALHLSAPQRTAWPRHRSRHRHGATSQQHRTCAFFAALRQCDRMPICAHTLTPCVSPGFQGFASGGRCCGTKPPLEPPSPSPSLVGRYLVAMHLKHATNRLLFICANRACRAA